MSVIDDLLAPADQQQILDSEVIPEFVRQGVKTTDWEVGDVSRADAFTAAKLRQLSRDQVKVLAATRFGDYVFGFVPLPGATDAQQADLLSWAPIIAWQGYGITPIDATNTLRRIRLTNSTANAYNKPAGRITLKFASGNRYISHEAYVSAGNDAVDVVFRSEFTVDATRTYSDTVNSSIGFLTADLPGVAATNPPSTYTPVTQVGGGLGTVTPSGTPAGSHSIAIRIDATGVVGVATWSYSLDGGAWVSVGATDTHYDDQFGYGVDLDFSNNGGNFVANATYYFSWPGSDVVQVGRSAETPQELGTRCRAQQPLLAFTKDSAGNALPISPTQAAYQALILQAFPEVKTCLVRPSGTVNNLIFIYIAGQGALLPGSVLAQVSAFLQSLQMISDRISAGSPPTQPITLADGSITVKTAQAVAAKAEAQRRIATYLSGVDANAPLPFGGLIDRSYIISLIRTTPGVTHVDNALTINGSATDYQLATATMATYAGNVGTSQTWVTV